jgi:hypothetical protein
VELELEALFVAVCAAAKPTAAMSTVATGAIKRILSQEDQSNKISEGFS